MPNKIFLFGAGASFGSDSTRVPPLGASLFSELQKFNPDGWGKLPTELATEFSEDFERGMTKLADTNSHAMPILQRAMAAYFFNFYPSPSNLYIKLGAQIRTTNWDGALATINYERLLELSLILTGNQPFVGEISPRENTVEFCLPHGCCHIFCESVRAGAPGVSISGVGVTTDGPVRVITDPQEFQTRINGDAFPPVMSYFQPDKGTTSGRSFIINQRKRWEELALGAKVIGIVGVRVRPSEEHIWEPIKQSKAKVVYCAGKEGGEEYLKWKNQVRPHSEDKILFGYFDKSFASLCKELGLK